MKPPQTTPAKQASKRASSDGQPSRQSIDQADQDEFEKWAAARRLHLETSTTIKPARLTPPKGAGDGWDQIEQWLTKRKAEKASKAFPQPPSKPPTN